VHDPGIGFITLTRVQVTADLQLARVYYTTMGDEKARKDTARALQRATPFLRRHVGGRLQLRRVPELEFRFDESVAHQDRIEQILRDLHEEEAKREKNDDSES
jgi:ribosome-binding factor A